MTDSEKLSYAIATLEAVKIMVDTNSNERIVIDKSLGVLAAVKP